MVFLSSTIAAIIVELIGFRAIETNGEMYRNIPKIHIEAIDPARSSLYFLCLMIFRNRKNANNKIMNTTDDGNGDYDSNFEKK